MHSFILFSWSDLTEHADFLYFRSANGQGGEEVKDSEEGVEDI